MRPHMYHIDIRYGVKNTIKIIYGLHILFCNYPMTSLDFECYAINICIAYTTIPYKILPRQNSYFMVVNGKKLLSVYSVKCILVILKKVMQLFIGIFVLIKNLDKQFIG